MHDGIDGREHDQRLLAADQARQLRECGQPLGEDAAMRRHPVIGLAVPGRELQHRKIRREERQRACQLLQARPVAAHHGETYGWRLWPRRDRARQIRNDKTLGALGDVGKCQRATGNERLRGRLSLLFHSP